MWTKTYSKTFQGIKKEDVWSVWIDVNNWPKWHGDLDYCKMEGPFEVGNYFMLKPKGVNAVKIVLTEIDEGCKFTDCTTFFGAKMYDTHVLEETPEGLKLTNTLIVKGPLKWLWIKLVAQNVADTVPQEMEALVNFAKVLYG
ncbi:MAG: polyketide cyclase [Alphaproteobacteria bacterium]